MARKPHLLIGMAAGIALLFAVLGLFYGGVTGGWGNVGPIFVQVAAYGVAFLAWCACWAAR